MSAVEPSGGSTVPRILFGAQLRRLREVAGYSRDDAGYTIRATASKMSRLKLGRVSFKEHDVADPLSLHDVVDPIDRDSPLGLAREANAPGWWHRYSDVLPDWFEAYVGSRARGVIRTYEVQFVPGLLQTADYCRSVAGLCAQGGAFTLLQFFEEDLPDVGYVEQLTGGLYPDKRQDIDRYVEGTNRLSAEIETPETRSTYSTR